MSVRPGPLQVHDPDVIDVGERYPLNLAQQLVKTDKSLQPARESPLAIRNAASATTGAVDKLAGGDSADTTSRKRRIQDPPSPSRRRISGEAKAPSRALKHIQTIYSHDSPKDVTVRLELPINEDLDLELEEFARLGRTGDFKAAQDFFQHHLGEQLANPYIFIQYATILFEMGDLKRFTSLNADLALGSDLTRPVIGERGGDTRNEDDDDDGLEFVGVERQNSGRQDAIVKSSSPRSSLTKQKKGARTDDPGSRSHRDENAQADRNKPSKSSIKASNRSITAKDNTQSRSPPTTISRLDYGNLAPEHDELQLLGWNWRLLNALAQFNLNESIDKVRFEANAALRELSFGQDLGSTEVQIVSLVMRIYGQVKSCVPDLFTSQTEQLLVNWVDFSGLYQSLLSQGRVWDFRDLVCAAFSVFGPQHWEKLTGDKAMESILGDFAYDMDESTCLALLDILASTTVDPALTPGILSDGTKLSIPTAQSLAESIIASYPKSMRSRPFMRWILTQTLDPGGGDDAKVPDSSQELVRHLETLPGAPFTRKHVQRDWITLPVYVPKDSEIPRWEVPDVPKEAVEPVRLVLNLANELDDYSTQALCYKLLILRSQDPTPLFKELIHLQKTIQGDRYGLLQTCLSSYIGSTDRAAQVNLLDELAEFGDWVGSTEIHDPEMYWARDFIRLALTRAVGRPSNPSSLQLSPSEMHYYMWLPENARDFTRKALAIKEWPTRVSKAIASSVSKDEPQGVTPSKRTRVISTFSSEDDMISGDDESETKGEKWDVENERKVENERLERARKDLERLRRANVRASLERAREEKMGEWERQFRDELELKEAKRELEKIKEEDARRVMENRIRKEIEIEMLAEREREERTRKEHKYLKEAAIAEWKAKEEERAEKERKERESDDRDYLRRVEEDLFASGLERQDIERIFWKMSNAPRSRPLWTRMSLEHLEVDTLKHYGFEFVYDSNPAFVFVKRWVPQWERRSLWEHSRILRDIREGKKTSDERNGREGVMHDPHSQSMPNAEDASDVDESHASRPESRTSSSSGNTSVWPSESDNAHHLPFDHPQEAISPEEAAVADQPRDSPRSYVRGSAVDVGEDRPSEEELQIQSVHEDQLSLKSGKERSLFEKKSGEGPHRNVQEDKDTIHIGGSQSADQQEDDAVRHSQPKAEDSAVERIEKLPETGGSNEKHDIPADSSDRKPPGEKPKSHYKARSTFRNEGAGNIDSRQRGMRTDSTGIWDAWEETKGAAKSKTRPSNREGLATSELGNDSIAELGMKDREASQLLSEQTSERTNSELHNVDNHQSNGSSNPLSNELPATKKGDRELGEEPADTEQEPPKRDDTKLICDEPEQISSTAALDQDSTEAHRVSLEAEEKSYRTPQLYRRPTVNEESDIDNEDNNRREGGQAPS